jgi:hypothetical protein
LPGTQGATLNGARLILRARLQATHIRTGKIEELRMLLVEEHELDELLMLAAAGGIDDARRRLISAPDAPEGFVG